VRATLHSGTHDNHITPCVCFANTKTMQMTSLISRTRLCLKILKNNLLDMYVNASLVFVFLFCMWEWESVWVWFVLCVCVGVCVCVQDRERERERESKFVCVACASVFWPCTAVCNVRSCVTILNRTPARWNFTSVLYKIEQSLFCLGCVFCLWPWTPVRVKPQLFIDQYSLACRPTLLEQVLRSIF